MAESQFRSAAETVLAIPELLESILVRVDMVTLLVSASRVSKAWKDFMDGSPAIQQALFFRPISTDVSQAVIHGLGDASWPSVPGEEAAADQMSERQVINPLLAKKFESCFFDFGQTYSCHRRANTFYELPWASGPEPAQVVKQYWGGWCQVRPEKGDSESARAQEESRRRFMRRGASWRRMLVSQPPPPSLGYMRFDICNLTLEGQKVLSSLIKPKSETSFVGLRMGELYDIVQHQAGHHGRHSLWFRVLWGKPTGSFAFKHVEDTFERLMSQTSVVVEFMHADDTTLVNHPQDPADAKVFDAMFRCEDYKEVEIDTEETGADAVEFPNFNPRYVVWHWILEDDERV
ncbi:hypothetical protein EsH8_IV_000259 [Colletotrichum jinshuiense]